MEGTTNSSADGQDNKRDIAGRAWGACVRDYVHDGHHQTHGGLVYPYTAAHTHTYTPLRTFHLCSKDARIRFSFPFQFCCTHEFLQELILNRPPFDGIG